jgi:hypothetical protein
MILGVAFYSFTIGSLQSIINNIDVKAQELQVKLRTLTGFAKRNNLPEQLVGKIKRFLENNNTDVLSISEYKELLNELPASLRNEVVRQTYKDVIRNIKFFDQKDPDFLWAILPILKPMKVYSRDILYN